MFKKLFKKATTANQQAVIEAIHNEFDLAGDKLLAEAKEILAANIDTSKGERLRSLGFSNSKAATDAKTITDMKNRNREIAERVEYFKTYYPSYKFITEEMVEAICKKYGLICGDCSYYIGDVPAKNVSEMERFNLRDEDCDKIKYDWFKADKFGYLYPSIDKNDAIYGYVMYDRSVPSGYQVVRIFDTSKTHEYKKPKFKICAPVKDFDTRYMRIEKGYRLENIPDPIVLQPVKGGYLIVSKWGLEANDESLVNETNN